MILEEATFEAGKYEIKYLTPNSWKGYFKARGYKCVFAWEPDLMREEGKEYVLHILRKAGIAF